MSATNPLSPLTYCRRNLPRIVPMAVVIVLSVFLIAAVVTIVNSVDLTVTTIYNYTRIITPIIPQHSALSVDAHDESLLKHTGGVGRVIDTSGFFMNINTVFGQVPFICFGLSSADRNYVLGLSGDHLSTGRWPQPGKPEAVLAEGLVRNKKLKLGSIVAGPRDQGGIAGTPVPVRLVGILSGPTWIAFTDKKFVDVGLPFQPRVALVTARDPSKLAALSARLDHLIDRTQVQVLSYHNLVRDLRHSLEAMYLIMTLVNAMVILVVALMSGMLSNIYFTQRISEFATLAAIGIRRATLLWHAVSETAIVTGIGWVIGMTVTWILMALFKGRLFEPRGMLINPCDQLALFYTIPIPFIITAFAVATIAYRLSRLDPVTIIERR
ncbi:MAG TPA: ABC transporter permease [Capsulimonadaceae bacterium]|nr:ABC transporter permease [Capsulimonadaceae bacterium]